MCYERYALMFNDLHTTKVRYTQRWIFRIIDSFDIIQDIQSLIGWL